MKVNKEKSSLRSVEIGDSTLTFGSDSPPPWNLRRVILSEDVQNGETLNDKWLESPQASTKPRLDIVRKTIFRNMKKFYSSAIKKIYDYTRKKLSQRELSEQVYAHSREYVLRNFKSVDVEKMTSVLITLIDTKQKFIDRCNGSQNLHSQIRGLLRSFNIAKAKQLCNVLEFSILVTKYLDRDSSLDEILADRIDTTLRSTYMSVITEIREQWLNTQMLD